MPNIPHRTAAYPVFAEYGLDDLAARTGYKARYLLDVATGHTEATRRLRFTFVAILGRPEADLFGNTLPQE